jgi:hypothetical protein
MLCCRFGGASDEFILSGSDDSRAYIYCAHTGKLIKKLTGHAQIVNVSIMHPYLPLVATSGIDSEIRLWKYKQISPKARDSSGSRSNSDSDSDSDSDSGSGGYFGSGFNPDSGSDSDSDLIHSDSNSNSNSNSNSDSDSDSSSCPASDS